MVGFINAWIHWSKTLMYDVRMGWLVGGTKMCTAHWFIQQFNVRRNTASSLVILDTMLSMVRTRKIMVHLWCIVIYLKADLCTFIWYDPIRARALTSIQLKYKTSLARSTSDRSGRRTKTEGIQNLWTIISWLKTDFCRMHLRGNCGGRKPAKTSVWYRSSSALDDHHEPKKPLCAMCATPTTRVVGWRNLEPSEKGACN